MSKFVDIQQDTPRLVIEFKHEDGKEQFGWGIIGQMPVMTLAGFIVRVQAELAFRKPEECDRMALVIVYDKDDNTFDYVVDSRIPVDSLVGMLEAIKLTLVQSQMMAQQQAQQNRNRLFGPDGSIYRRG